MFGVPVEKGNFKYQAVSQPKGMSHHVILYPIIFPLYPYCVLDWKCHYSLFNWILKKKSILQLDIPIIQ